MRLDSEVTLGNTRTARLLRVFAIVYISTRRSVETGADGLKATITLDGQLSRRGRCDMRQDKLDCSAEQVV